MMRRVARAAVALICATAAAVTPVRPAYADETRDAQWHLRYLQIDKVHRISQGDGVTVAVLDTGVSPHRDLRDNLIGGTDSVVGGSGDGLGDTDGHGTAMAGLIAAHGRGTSTGALGIAPKAKILSVRQQTPKKKGDTTHLADGIEWAVRNGAKVINVSMGSSPSVELIRALDFAAASDVVVVAAAGNKPDDIIIQFPANMRGALAVGASDKNGNRSNVSVTGKELALLAPGTDIVSTGREDRYYKGTGTSNSTAIVSGAVALIRSKFPELSAEEVIHRLTYTAVDKGEPGHDREYGYGVIDILAALTADVPPLASTATPDPDITPTDHTPTPEALPLPRPGEPPSPAILYATLAALAVLAAIISLFVVRARRRHPRT